MIAFFGMGLLGSNFVRALRKRGETVHVWNRTAEKARALASEGATPFDDPAEAARGCGRIHLALGDDAAVDDVLERARAGIGDGSTDVTIVDHTTTSATALPERHRRWTDRGVRFVHAPVFMGPQNALQSTGLMLVSGAQSDVDAVRPALEAMTGKVVYLGPRVEAAASFKLLGNLFLMFLTTGLAEVLGLAKALEVPPREAASLFEHFNPGATVGARLQRMLSGDFSSPSWELAMARKDARIMLEEAARAGVSLDVLPAIAARMDAVIAQGHGHDDWTVLAKGALP